MACSVIKMGQLRQRDTGLMRGFFRNMLLNGELRMWEAESGASISRLDPLISVNCFLDLDASNATIAEAGAELDRRIVVFEKARRSS
ncbi:hypothetical protein [Sphingomonas sp. 22R3R2A-7]|jgi:hypothetical protein|uniref:hypothetical protein n=1 Tax=Sphingomonas sp. 22R3R2A-7 TaxID=3050230 RepID=UPI002FE252F0